ncbi:MAG: NAD(P)-dependent oxidoreductase [Stellaceae bacterium]
MKLALIGATGRVGSRLLAEALARGHDVTAISRHPEKLAPHPRLRAVAGDVFDSDGLAALLRGSDAVIHAYAPPRDIDRTAAQIRATQSLIAALKQAGVRRILAVGGAGTLESAPGVRVMDTPELPREWMGGAVSTAQVKYLLEKERELEWTSLSPSLWLEPGQRTGKFRLGTDQILRDQDGRSHISFEDYAVAMIDELETPRHSFRRFTVGY